jgi:hypothetical protein
MNISYLQLLDIFAASKRVRWSSYSFTFTIVRLVCTITLGLLSACLSRDTLPEIAVAHPSLLSGSTSNSSRFRTKGKDIFVVRTLALALKDKVCFAIDQATSLEGLPAFTGANVASASCICANSTLQLRDSNPQQFTFLTNFS